MGRLARLSWVVVLTSVLAALGLGDAHAEEPPKETAEASAPAAARVLTKEEAAPKIDALKKASKRRKAADVLPALDDLEGTWHEEFRKPLVKLLAHGSADVAIRAAALLGAEPIDADDAKAREAAAEELWKKGWAHKTNDDRHDVRGAVLRAIGRLGHRIGAAELREVERLWNRQFDQPDTLLAPALLDVVAYAATTKDRRLAPALAEAIDEPVAGDVHAPTNPPASYWEARWKLWKALEADVIRALARITGQTFRSGEEARSWLQANPETNAQR
jgi:hypothetical protein